ncbi:MAG: glycosyl transferase [Arcobacter sp.]|nr:MAG: glycosyl transferase [Arcobacter sp.]
MKISVIIPTYNRANFLLSAINSIKSQTYRIDEIIVVDDGSSDNTKEVLKNQNIKYIFQENKGVSSARNRGIKESKNDWIAFLDSDDIWEKEKIEKHINIHKTNQNIFCSYTDETWNRNGKTIKLKPYQEKEEPTFLNSLRLCKIGVSTFFCHKNIFEKVGYFDEELLVCEDYDLWLRILKDYEIKYINEKLTLKKAGHKNQLSFETKLIDTYRIKSLEKHLNSKYKKEVLNELIYKMEIVLSGAKKHGNTILEKQYTEKLNSIKLSLIK